MPINNMYTNDGATGAKKTATTNTVSILNKPISQIISEAMTNIIPKAIPNTVYVPPNPVNPNSYTPLMDQMKSYSQQATNQYAPTVTNAQKLQTTTPATKPVATTTTTAKPATNTTIAKPIPTATPAQVLTNTPAQSASTNVATKNGAPFDVNTAPIAYNLGQQFAPTYDAQFQAINDMLAQMQNQQLQAQREYERQMQAQREYMDWALSPETYNDIFGKIMQQQMPLYDAQKAEIAGLAQEQRGLADIDAESRGLYNSGVGAVMQGKISELERQEVARALAQLQAQATGLTSDYQNKLVQRAQMEGNWAGQARQLNQGDLSQYTDAFLGGNKLGLDYMNSDRNYNINLAQIGLDEKRIAENARQFDSGQAWDMDKFAQTLGLQYKQLDVESKIAMTNAGLRQQELNLAQNKYKDEKELLALQKDRERLSDISGAYSFINQSKQQGTSLDLLKSSLSIYKDIYDDKVYRDLIDTAEKLYNPPKKTGLFSSSTRTDFVPGYGYISDHYK